MRTLLDEQLEAAGARSEVVVETAHVASVVPLVLAGAGAAVLPEGLAADAAAKGARVVRLDPLARAAVHLVWRRGRLSVLAEQLLLIASDRQPQVKPPPIPAARNRSGSVAVPAW